MNDPMFSRFLNTPLDLGRLWELTKGTIVFSPYLYLESKLLVNGHYSATCVR